MIHDYFGHDDEEDKEVVSRAVNRVNLDVEAGQFIAILGHNGSGKSTLAKHINGILQPTSGTVWVKGMDTADEAHLWDVRQSAGMVFQNPDNQIIGSIVKEDVGFDGKTSVCRQMKIWKRVFVKVLKLWE